LKVRPARDRGGVQRVTNLPAFYGTLRVVRVHKSQRLLLALSCALEGFKRIWAIITGSALMEMGGRGIEKDRKVVRNDKGTKGMKDSK
jgi:hypothetical protein